MNMTDWIDDVVGSMSRFSELLHLVGLPELGDSYKSEAEKLNSDRSDLSLQETREWIRETFQYQGGGSIPDRYVAKADGSVDRPLNTEYRELMRIIGVFAGGGSIS